MRNKINKAGEKTYTEICKRIQAKRQFFANKRKSLAAAKEGFFNRYEIAKLEVRMEVLDEILDEIFSMGIKLDNKKLQSSKENREYIRTQKQLNTR